MFDGKVLIDADACPVRRIVVREAEKRAVPVVLVTDDSHQIDDGYGDVFVVSQGADAADYKLISMTRKGDLVITQDYGVASMALGAGAMALSQNGLRYTADNIDRLLFERHIGGKLRRGGKRSAHIRPRTAEDDTLFLRAYLEILDEGK